MKINRFSKKVAYSIGLTLFIGGLTGCGTSTPPGAGAVIPPARPNITNPIIPPSSITPPITQIQTTLYGTTWKQNDADNLPPYITLQFTALPTPTIILTKYCSLSVESTSSPISLSSTSFQILGTFTYTDLACTATIKQGIATYTLSGNGNGYGIGATMTVTLPGSSTRLRLTRIN